MDLSKKSGQKPLYIKLTPGTELYVKVEQVSWAIGVTMTKAARYMMRNGHLGFTRFAKSEGLDLPR